MKKLKLTLLLFLMTVLSCNKQEEITIQPEPITVESIDPNQDQTFKKLFNSSTPSGRIANDYSDNIDWSSAIKITNHLDSTYRYTLNVKDTSSWSFTNIVFKANLEEELEATYFMRFLIDEEWLGETNYELELSDFTGKLEVFNQDMIKVLNVELTNGTGYGSIVFDGSENGRTTGCGGSVDLGGGGGTGGGSGSGSGGGTGSSGSGGGDPCIEVISTATGLKFIDCGTYFGSDANCDITDGEDWGGDDGGSGDENGPIGVLISSEVLQDQIDQIQTPEEKRKAQLSYIKTHNGEEGRAFVEEVENLLSTPGLDLGEVSDINQIVNDYYEDLIGRLIMAHFSPVAEAAYPFIQLALIETGTGVLFQAVKGLLSVRWGVQLAKIGINTTSITNLTNRLTNAVKIASDGKSVNLTIGGRNLYGSSGLSTTTSSRVAYRINGVTTNEAKAIFNDMTAGRQVKRVDYGGGKFRETTVWSDSNGIKNSITYRNFSKTGQTGDVIIDINMPSIRTGTVELKFFP